MTYCKKIITTNGCGHVGETTYKYCNGDHDNHTRQNQLCFRRSSGDKSSTRNTIIVSRGTSYCSTTCRARVTGWRCCTCSYALVHGHDDMDLGMLVHRSRDGLLHAFCSECNCDRSSHQDLNDKIMADIAASMRDRRRSEVPNCGMDHRTWVDAGGVVVDHHPALTTRKTKATRTNMEIQSTSELPTSSAATSSSRSRRSSQIHQIDKIPKSKVRWFSKIKSI